VGAKTINYTTDAAGQILVRTQTTNGSANSPHQFSFYHSGALVGQIGNDGSDNVDYATSIARNAAADGAGPYREGSYAGSAFADFDQNYNAINSNSATESGAGGSSYTVRSGDTLQSIAQAAWGDAGLWYMLAEANALSASSSLSAGQSLLIPAKVTGIHNSAATLRPYDAGKAIGDVQPGSPVPTAASGGRKGKCGIVGQIILVAIAVAVTYLSAGTLTAALGPVLGGAAAGAAGSVASQAFGLTTGIQTGGFSFKGVALAALGGGNYGDSAFNYICQLPAFELISS
jgi:trimeric autotransporter adhesin